MKSNGIPAVAIVMASLAVSVLAVFGGRDTSAQDTGQAKYAVRVPNGLAFSELGDSKTGRRSPSARPAI
jgi:hypothetical protein